MDPVTPSCYARLEQRIRSTYRTIGSVGGSVLGHMGIALLAECVGAVVGEYFTSRATPYMEEFSVDYPRATHMIVATAGVVVLYGSFEGKRYRLAMTGSQMNASVAVAVVGAVYFPLLWESFGEQRFPYLLLINQIAGRILGGYVALMVVGVVPELWNNAQWRSGYSMRMLRYEAVGLPLDVAAGYIAPQGLLPWVVFMVPRIAICSSLKGIAFQADRLVPFAVKCVRNMGLARKQIVPLLIQMSFQKYVGEERQALIQSSTRAFCKSLQKSVVKLFPPLYYVMSLHKILPIQCTKPLEAYFKGGVKQRMGVVVLEGIEKLDENSAEVISWCLRSIVEFVKFIEEKDHIGIKAVQKTWVEAFLNNPGNDEAITRKSFLRVLKHFLSKRYGARYATEYKIIAGLCKSQNLKKSIIEGLTQLPLLEKDFTGFAFTQDKHLRYWEAACEIYLPHFLTVAALHPQDFGRLMTSAEHHELIEHIQKFICDVYVDVVLPKKIAPWVRGAIQKGVESVFTVQQIAADFAGNRVEVETNALSVHARPSGISEAWEEVSRSAALVWEYQFFEADKKKQEEYIVAHSLVEEFPLRSPQVRKRKSITIEEVHSDIEEEFVMVSGDEGEEVEMVAELP